VLVGGGVHPHLGEHRLGVRGVGGEQVNGGHLAVAGAAKRLAVEGQVFPVGGLKAGLHPTGESVFDRDGIEGGQSAREGGGGRGEAATESEGEGQLGAELAAEAGDAGQTGAAHQNGQSDHPEEGRQGVANAVSTAGIGDGGQTVEQGGATHARPIPNTPTPAKMNLGMTLPVGARGGTPAVAGW